MVKAGAITMMQTIRAGTSIDQSQAEIRFLIEKNADGIIVVDDDGIVMFANPAAEKIFGRPSEALINLPLGIPLVGAETMEITVHRPGGGQVEAEIRMVETTWDNRPARLASLRDISARRALEERLRQKAKMEAIGRLTAGVAHDFNNYLTVVIGNLERAQRLLAASGTPEMRAIENAMAGARRASMLTERLLAFTRQKPLDPRVIDVNALVSGMSELLCRTLGEAIEVHTSLAENTWQVEADPAELEAAILNLAVNARDAMPGGGRLTIETANVELDSAYTSINSDAKAGPFVLVSVADTGVGMTPEVLKQVFEPFFTTKSDGRGTGLGLSQVYGFAKQSGGHVRLYSEPGFGTTAKLYLPPARERISPHAHIIERASADPIPRSRSGESILLVEDDDCVREHSASCLRELGYVVFEAADAASALKLIESEPDIRLLFTDLGLPGTMNGKALAERAREIRESLQVLITTAYAASALVHEGRLDPGLELLSKPFTFGELAKRIHDLLSRDRA
jgi:signal transduction histidine kinase/CheY-like chemotaxis protein